MRYLPIGLDLRGRICIVVGGGRVGARKTGTLIQAGARVTVVSPEATQEVWDLADQGAVLWERREYQSRDLDGAFLAVAATDDQATNARVVQDAGERGILICDSSSASRSQVIFGAVHRRDPVTVAVFTEGKDPSLARRTRDRIRDLGQQWGEP